MANNKVVVNFDFKANIGDVQSNLNALKNNLLQIQTIGSNTSSFLGINQGLKQASIAAQQLQTHLAGATNPFTKQLDLSMFSKSLQSAGLNVTQLSNSLLGAGATGQQAFKNLALTIASAQAPALQLSATMGKLMTTFANNARWMVSSSVLTGFVSGIREAVDYTKELNESLTDIRIVTGKSKEEMDSVARSANKMAKELKTSTAEIVKGQLIYYQQGDSAALAAKKAEITTKAANVSFGTSQEQMSEYLTAIWNSYQVGEDQLEQFVDVLAAVGATTATSMEEIATAMQKVAATGNAVGVSYEQLTATIATISSVTRTSSEQVGTALKTIYARIGDLKAGGLDEDDIGLGQVSSGLKKVGVEILDTNNNIRDMGEVVEEIGGKWEGWTEAQQQAIVQLIAGKRQYTQMMALFENWDMYESTLSTAEGADGELNKQQEIWAESWEAASQNVQASLESIYTKVFDDDVFIDLLNILNGVIVTFDTLTDAFGGIGPILMQISALILHHFKVPIIDALANVKYGFDILTGNAQRAHEQMRNQFFQGIDFSQMDAGLKMEIQSLGELTEVQDKYKLNMSQIHKADRLQIENSIEIAQALRNQALAQQEAADKQKQSIANAITASKASNSTKNAARGNLERVSADAIQTEMARSTLKNAFQDSTGKYNPTAMLNKSGKESTNEDRAKFLTQNQEKFNAVLKLTEEALQKQISKDKEIIALNEKKLEQSKLLEAQQAKENFQNSSKGKRRDELINKKSNGGLNEQEAAELKKLNQEYGHLEGAITKATNARDKAKAAIDNANNSLRQNDIELKKTKSAMDIISTATSGGSVESRKFKFAIDTLNNSLKSGTLSQDQFAEQFREIGASLGLTGDQLDAFVKEILEMITSTAGANMSQEEFQRQLAETAKRIKEAGDASDEMKSKINADSLMNAASAMMSMSSAASSISSMFKTFGDESASAVDKVTSATGALTQGIFAVTMAMKMLKGANPWLIGITIALSVLPLLIEGIDALWVTQEEKVEKLKKETEELTEKYNEQKAVIEELEAKKEAGVDNQAQLDALDEEIKREERKLKILEEQKKVKEEETNKEENKEIENKFNAHGTYSSKNYTAITHGGPVDASQMRSRKYESGDRLKIGGGAINVQDAALYEQFMKEYANYEISKDELLTKLKDNDVLTEKGLESITTQLDYQENLHSEHLTNMLQDIETYTEQGGELTDNMLYNLQLSLKELYGGDMTSEAIAQLGSYISGIDEMSDTELQSLLVKLFPDDDKETLVERFKQGLQEIDGEMDQFGKKQTLAKSLENAGKAIDKVQSALKEIDDTGFMSYSTIEEMGTALDKAGVASAEWKQALYDANGNAEKTKEVLGQIASEITNATIEAQEFSKNLHFNSDGSLTTESQEYIGNVEKMIAAQLRSNGVLNAEEEAHKRVQAAVIAARLAKVKSLTITDKFADEILQLAKNAKLGSAQISTLEKVLTILNNKNLNMGQKAQEILKIGKAAIASSASVIALEEALEEGQEVQMFDLGSALALPGVNKPKYKTVRIKASKEEIERRTQAVIDDLLENALNISGLDISVTDPSDSDSGGGGDNEPYWLKKYNQEKAKLEHALARGEITQREMNQTLNDLWATLILTIPESDYAEDKYLSDINSIDEEVFNMNKENLEQNIENLDKALEQQEISIENYSKQFLSNIDTIYFTLEEKKERIDKMLDNMLSHITDVFDQTEKEWERKEFDRGIIDYNMKAFDYEATLRTLYDMLLIAKQEGKSWVEQLKIVEEIYKVRQQIRDLNKEQYDLDDKIAEDYMEWGDFEGYENGDNRLKAESRELAELINLGKDYELVLSLFGTQEEYNLEVSKKRLEYQKSIRDAIKETLELEKELKVARLESQKTLLNGEYDTNNQLREARKNINDQLQESLTMYQYLDKSTRKLLFNEEDYLELSKALNKIETESLALQERYRKKIANAKTQEDLEFITAEYERQNELLMKRYEIAEKELGIVKARTELENTLKERNTQMFINGRWQWVADQKAVIEAQKKLNDAEFDKETAELENEKLLEEQKLDTKIDQINLRWEKAVKDLEGKTLSLSEIMDSFNGTIDEGTKKFAKALGLDIEEGEYEAPDDQGNGIKFAHTGKMSDENLKLMNEVVYWKGIHNKENNAWSWGELSKAYDNLSRAGYEDLVQQLKKSTYYEASVLYGQEKMRAGYKNDDKFVKLYSEQNELTGSMKNLSEQELSYTQQLVNDFAFMLDNPTAFSKEEIKIAKENASRQLDKIGATNAALKILDADAVETHDLLDDIIDAIQNIRIGSTGSRPATGYVDPSSKNADYMRRYLAGDSNVMVTHNSIQEKDANGNWRVVSTLAKGSLNALAGLTQINEIGEETFVTPDGHFRNFAGGEVVFTHEQSQRLFSLLNADLFDINKMPRVGNFEQSNSNDTYISIGGISIDTTTQDGKDLVEILQRITNI